ncbi:MAG: RICIN domain-containing protein, partial [Gammaproteobacteria bacterium]|nr:RICIN domain-containing protein [Gammaproteobacteria bacterium]
DGTPCGYGGRTGYEACSQGACVEACDPGATVTQSVAIQVTKCNQDSLAKITHFSGPVTVATGAASPDYISMPCLLAHSGSLTVEGSDVEYIELATLRKSTDVVTFSGAVKVIGNPLLHTLDYGAVHSKSGELTLRDNCALETLAVGWYQSSGAVRIQNNDLLEQFFLSNLTSHTGDFRIEGNGAMPESKYPMGDSFGLWLQSNFYYSGNGQGPSLTTCNKHIRFVHSGLCVSAVGGEDGDNVVQRYCSSDNEQWTIIDVGDGYYSVKNVFSGKCIDNRWDTHPGGRVDQWSCNSGFAAQRIRFNDLGAGQYGLSFQQGGLYMDVEAFSPADGGNIHQWAWHGGDNQRVTVVNAASSAYTIAKRWEFNTPGDNEGWVSMNHMHQSTAGCGSLDLDSTGGDPHIYGPDNLSVDAAAYQKVRIRMRNMTSNTSGRIYFATNTEGFSQDNSEGFTTVANDSGPREYVVDMRDVITWAGTIRQIRLDPTDATSGAISIDWIRITD